jgi:hypothetical protein
VLNPQAIAIQRDLAGGLTTANILHGSANPSAAAQSPSVAGRGKGRRPIF